MRKFSKKINYYCTHAGALVLLALLLLTVADVFMRYVFNTPIRGSYELTAEILIPLSVFLAGAHAHDSGDHVVVDIIYEKLPFIAKWVISMLGHLVYLLIIALLCWRLFVHSNSLREVSAWTSQLEIPTWPVLLIGAIAMLGYVLSLLFELGAIIIKREVLGNDAG